MRIVAGPDETTAASNDAARRRPANHPSCRPPTCSALAPDTVSPPPKQVKSPAYCFAHPDLPSTTLFSICVITKESKPKAAKKEHNKESQKTSAQLVPSPPSPPRKQFVLPSRLFHPFVCSSRQPEPATYTSSSRLKQLQWQSKAAAASYPSSNGVYMILSSKAASMAIKSSSSIVPIV